MLEWNSEEQLICSGLPSKTLDTCAVLATGQGWSKSRAWGIAQAAPCCSSACVLIVWGWVMAKSTAQGTAPWLTLSRCSCSCSKHPHSLCRSPSARDHGPEWQLWGLKFLCSSKKGVVRTVTDHDPSNTPPCRRVQHAEELGRNLPSPASQSPLHMLTTTTTGTQALPKAKVSVKTWAFQDTPQLFSHKL